MFKNLLNLKHFRIEAGIAALVFAVCCSGCYETYQEEPLGTLTVPFDISYNGSGCEAAGVVRVLAVLDDGDGKYETEVDCNQYKAVFENIEEGEYSLSLYGLDADGVPVVDNLTGGPTTVEVVAYEDSTPKTAMLLTEAPVVLWMRWGLGWGSCQSRKFSKFQVQVLDPKNKSILVTSLSCQTAGTVSGEFRVVPDSKRALVHPNIGKIVIQPTDRRGRSIGKNFIVTIDDVTVPGPGKAIEISFGCDQSSCYLPGSCSTVTD